jgi:hypothetical protein
MGDGLAGTGKRRGYANVAGGTASAAELRGNELLAQLNRSTGWEEW